jgi:putative aminopeptidase FrvX
MSVCYHKTPVCQHEARTKLGIISVGSVILLKSRSFVFRRIVSGFVDNRASVSCQQELLVVFVMVVNVAAVVFIL